MRQEPGKGIGEGKGRRKRQHFLLDYPITLLALAILPLLAGCGPFFDANNVQDQVDQPAGVLGGGRTVGETFVASADGLSAVDVQIAIYPGIPSSNGSLVLSLWPVPASGGSEAPLPEPGAVPLATERVPEASLTPNQWIQFAFNPVARSAGRRYLVLASTTDAVESPVTLWATSHLVDPGRSRLANGEIVLGSLVFRAYLAETPLDVAAETIGTVGRDGALWPVALLLCVIPGLGVASLVDRDETDPAAFLGLAVGWSVLLAPLGLAIATPPRLGLLAGLITLVGSSGIFLWRRPSLHLSSWSAVGIGSVVVALGIRAITAKGLVAPMWGDPIQHSYVAALILDSRGVPSTYGSLVPPQIFDYHFGFQTLAADAAWLTKTGVASSVLATGQILDALITLALYRFARDLTGSAPAAAVAAALVAMVSTQPTYFVTWGRYPELAGLVALPAAAFALRQALTGRPPGRLASSAWLSKDRGRPHEGGQFQLADATGSETADGARGRLEEHQYPRSSPGVEASAGRRASTDRLKPRPLEREVSSLTGRSGVHRAFTSDAGQPPCRPDLTIEMARRALSGLLSFQGKNDGRSGWSWPIVRCTGFLICIAPVLIAAIATAALVLVHPRLGVFLGCLGIAMVVANATDRLSRRALLADASRLALVGGLSSLLLAPWAARLWSAHAQQVVGSFRWSPIDFPLGLATAGNDRWILVVALVGLGLALARRTALAVLIVVWSALILVLANPATFRLPFSLFVNNGSVAIALFVPGCVLAGYFCDSVATLAQRKRLPRHLADIVAGLVFVAGLSQAPGLMTLANPCCLLIRPGDLGAIEWVRQNTPPDARFMINGNPWVDTVWMGSDAGYWLPVLAQRQTTLPPLFYAVGPKSEVNAINRLAAQVSRQADDPTEIAQIARTVGARYVFIGTRGGPLDPGLLVRSGLFRVDYGAEGAWVLEVVGHEDATSRSTVTGMTPDASIPPSDSNAAGLRSSTSG